MVRTTKKESIDGSHIKDEYKSGYDIVGWINYSKNYDVFVVVDVETGGFVGSLLGRTLRRLVRGEIKGCPICIRTKNISKQDGEEK